MRINKQVKNKRRKKEEIIKEIQTRGVVSCNKGNEKNKVAFIFACPGKCEEYNSQVLAVETGNNLDFVLTELKNKCKKLFPTNNRYYYFLTNASDRVYYKGYKFGTYINDRTTPYKIDIKQQSNVSRLKNELEPYEYLICFGGDAKNVIKLIKKDDEDFKKKIIAYVKHLSPRVVKPQKNSADDYFKIVAKKIYNQILTPQKHKCCLLKFLTYN